jgi:hypothetical protein
MKVRTAPNVPITGHATDEPAVFLPENLLKRASSMMDKQDGHLPPCCLLDFDGELVPVARERFGATPCSVWPCFHTPRLETADRRNGDADVDLSDVCRWASMAYGDSAQSHPRHEDE